MYIFLDESGSFVNAPKPNAWNVIVAYMIPECDLSRKYKEARGGPAELLEVSHQRSEIKLREIKEADYFEYTRPSLQSTLPWRSSFCESPDSITDAGPEWDCPD